MERFELKGHRCLLDGNTSDPGLIFLWGVGRDYEDSRENNAEALERLLTLYKEQCGTAAERTAVLAYECTDWFNDYSPWKAEAAEFPQGFGGGGPEILSFLVGSAVPELRQRTSCSGAKMIPMGYSLSGLFSLWAGTESQSFDGAVCCSGSLFFPGWDEYADRRLRNKEQDLFETAGKVFYLSLGGKEVRTKSALLNSNGEAFRREEKRLKERGALVKFEWTGGGHFADSVKRLAAGMKWVSGTREKR